MFTITVCINTQDKYKFWKGSNFPAQKPKETSTKTNDLVKTASKCTDAMIAFVCVSLPSVYGQFTIDLGSICIKASDGFHLVSTRVSNMFPVSTPGGCMASSLMKFPCRVHGELM